MIHNVTSFLKKGKENVLQFWDGEVLGELHMENSTAGRLLLQQKNTWETVYLWNLSVRKRENKDKRKNSMEL